MKKIAVMVGSLRKESATKKIALATMKLFPEGYEAELVEIGNLPFYNEDFDTEGAPEVYTTFREKMKAADAVMFFTPEYNRALVPTIKNAIDVGSRPYGASVWNEKPGVVVSTSPSGYGGIAANFQTRQATQFVNIDLMYQPEAYVANSFDSIDAEGNLTPKSREYMQGIVDGFVAHIEK